MGRNLARALRRRCLRASAGSSTSMLPVDAPMKTLMPHASSVVDALDLLEVRVRRAEIEAVVDVARRRGDSAFLGERRAIRRRRLGVRHVQKARDAAAERRQRFGRERRLVREARLAAMHLVVDEAGQQVLAARDRSSSCRPDVAPVPMRSMRSPRIKTSAATTCPSLTTCALANSTEFMTASSRSDPSQR